MKPLRTLLVLLALAALAAHAPAQVGGHQDDLDLLGSVLRKPSLYDGLMIATALGPPVGHPLPGGRYFASQPFRVVDSRAFAPGTVVDLYVELPSSRNAPSPPAAGATAPWLPGFPTGARALVAARLPKDGALLVPVDLDNGTDRMTDRTVALGESARPAALMLALVPTREGRLYADPDPMWRLLGSLAGAIPGASDADAQAFGREIPYLHPSGHDYGFGRADDRFSLLFAGAVAHDTAYHRALVDYALNEAHYLGYAARYDLDVLQAAEEPDAFPDGPKDRLEFEEDPGYRVLWPKGYRPAPPPTEADDLAALRRAKSPTVAAYLLGGLAKPSDADVHALARFLDSPDPRLRWAIAERLAKWYGYAPPPKPIETTDADTRERHYASNPELDQVVAMWKGKLAAGTLP